MSDDDRYAVFGHPIGHSRSPTIHRLFAEQTGQAKMRYTAQDVTAEAFDGAIERFFGEGGKGLNCTVPLKELAWSIADRKSPRAERCRAVNTLAMLDGTLYGDNTDGIGLVRDLTVNQQMTLTGKRILILGAGGAGRGILGPLLEQHPKRLVIANRTVARAVELAESYRDMGAVAAGSFADLEGQSFDLILNATAACLQDSLPPLPDGIIAATGCCYDLAYGSQPTAFVRWGQQQHAARSLDGLGMLVEQAAEAFLLWRGVRPETAPVIEYLRRC